MMTQRLIVYADGGCVPNPGVGTYGVVVRRADDAMLVCQLRQTLDGIVTNNIAEWHGALAALDYLLAQPSDVVAELRMDSQLIVKQLLGFWRVRDEKLQPLASEARERLRRVRMAGARIDVRWVPREANWEADALT